MTAQDAMHSASEFVVRSHVEGGLVAIARNAGTYNLSFIPQMADGSWNLAGTILLGTFGSVEEAAIAAWSRYAATGRSWEAAPGNIAGNERALSSAPLVEGRHIRQHSHESPPQGFRLTFLGRPLHLQFILVSAGLLALYALTLLSQRSPRPSAK